MCAVNTNAEGMSEQPRWAHDGWKTASFIERYDVTRRKKDYTEDVAGLS